MMEKDADSNNVFRTPAPPPPLPRRVTYVYDESLGKCTDCISHIRGRSEMVHELIKAYGLLKLMDWRSSREATKRDLLNFHSSEYIDFLFEVEARTKGSEAEGDDVETSEEEDSFKSNFGLSDVDVNEDGLEEFGLCYDCPVFRNLAEFALRISGGTLVAAEALLEGAEIAINWCGGWHHAQRSEASGFCYVNDIVLGIHVLQQKFKHILYVDLDAHHGDGVENAFAFSDKVMTLSFHHYQSGYFPGTGKLSDIGKGRGKYFSLNIPLKSGVTDHQFKFLFDSIIPSIVRDFRPEALVVQCGADCLSKDPLGAFNLTTESITHCIQTLLNASTENKNKIPTLLLGGGGYNISNSARLWTSLTAETLNRKLDNNIPDNKYFLKYGPDFELNIQPSLRSNENDDDYISELINATLGEFLMALRKRKNAA